MNSFISDLQKRNVGRRLKVLRLCYGVAGNHEIRTSLYKTPADDALSRREILQNRTTQK